MYGQSQPTGGPPVESHPPLVSPGVTKLLHKGIDYVARQLRHASGMLEGLSYRMAGRHPSADVSDDVLADRIRSTVGPLEKRLDIPRVNVMVEDHVAILHGVVGDRHDAERLADAVLAVAGVRAVDSWLHVGLGAGDTRPSDGRAAARPSDAHERLVESAVRVGVPEAVALDVVRAVLGTFAERLPDGERDHVAHHLPVDVQPLFTPPRRIVAGRGARTVSELVERVCATEHVLPPERAEAVVEGVLATLRSLVPEESEDVAAVLPQELRDLWVMSVPG